MTRLTVKALAATVTEVIRTVTDHATCLAAHRSELEQLKREVAELRTQHAQAPIVVRERPSARPTLEHAVFWDKRTALGYREAYARHHPQRVFSVQPYDDGLFVLISRRVDA